MKSLYACMISFNVGCLCRDVFRVKVTGLVIGVHIVFVLGWSILLLYLYQSQFRKC